MRVTFAGGVGEHGRNCFLVEADAFSFLVDCGVMAGAAQPYPALTAGQIRGLRYVFLTHSHADHTGALGWLAAQGFDGTVVATAATLSQLDCRPARTAALEGLALPAGVALRWGRAGHCAGSVWLAFSCAGRPGRVLLFSGDYTENSLVYAVDPVRDAVADLAVLDSAYGPDPRTDDAMRQDFLAAVQPFAAAGRPVLFPVPRYGRGPELLLLLAGRWPEVPLYGDPHFLAQTAALARDPYWVRPSAREALRRAAVLPLPGGGDAPPEKGFCFISGPQLQTPAAQKLADAFAAAGGVVLTGAVDPGSGAARLAAQKRAVFARVPVHCADRGRLALQRQNRFARVVPYHTAAWPCRERVMVL